MRTARLICLALLALPAAALAQVPDEVSAAIAETNAAFKAAWNAGDAVAITKVYAEDAVVMPPGGEPMQGRIAIHAGFAEALSYGTKMDFETVEVLVEGDLAVEIGKFVETNVNGSHKDHGHYMSVLRKLEGRWLIVRDMWNSSMTP